MDLKIRNLCERGDKLKIKQDLQKDNTEEEAREHVANSIAIHPKDKGKGILDRPSNPSIVEMEVTLQNGAEFK